MRIPLNWMNDYFEAPVTDVEAIARALTGAGLEVEGVERVAPGFEHVITGKIVAADPHPNADRLRICKTDIGAAEPLQIVTGAQNVQVGDVIPVALIGANLPNGVEIKASKLRGVESFGMYCSLVELALANEAEGVHVFPAGTPVGMSAASVLEVGDTVIEVAVLANRPDALSVVGVARELAAAGLGKLKPIAPSPLSTEGASTLKVTIEAGDLCPRYAALCVEGLTVGPSPDWLKQRLELAGVRSISNVVDVTNYVLLELGQPLHAFDRAKIAEGTLTPRRARDGEEIVTLDGQTRKLDSAMLVIADENGAQAIAGVMGGAHSQVTEATSAIVLESAYFDPSSIRKTGKRLGLSSESSYRFERGVDPEGTMQALSRAAELLARVAGGKAILPAVDVSAVAGYPAPMVVELRPARIARVLGTGFSAGEIKEKFTAIGFVVTGDDPMQVRIPGWRRHDVTREIDLIEEVARLMGYDRIPSTLMPLDAIGSPGPREELVRRVRGILEGAGLSEVVTPSLTNQAALALAKAGVEGVVTLANPLADMAMLRTRMEPGLLEVARFNHYQGRSRGAYYEIGRTYHTQPDGRVSEPRWVSFLVMGEQATGVWKHAPEVLTADYFWAKGLVERLFATLGVAGLEASATLDEPALHPGRAARLSIDERFVGVVGEVHPEVHAAYDLPVGARSAIATLSLDALEALVSTAPRPYAVFGRYPAILRDLALVVSEDLPSASVVAQVRSMAPGVLESVEVFDRYAGPQVPEGKVSLGLRLRYRVAERTLSDEEIEPIHRRIVQAAEEAFGAAVRDK